MPNIWQLTADGYFSPTACFLFFSDSLRNSLFFWIFFISRTLCTPKNNAIKF